MAAFSFQMNKNVTAGEGGMIVTDDERLYLRANAAHDLGVPWVEGMPAEDSAHSLWGAGARMSEIAAAVIRAQLGKLDTITAGMRASKQRMQARLSDLPDLKWRRLHDPEGDSGPFMIPLFAEPGTARRFAQSCSGRGLTCIHLPAYGLHIYYNVKALVERRSNSPDGFPWTHPANVPLQRNYGRGALPQTDQLLDRSVVLPVPARMTPAHERDYIAIFRQAYADAVRG
jgi:8-amino-3,8-dideoxy-alpha-D-manno-octulosonate transaminase